MKKNKRWLLLLIIGFPSTFWLLLETSTINSKKLPYYGPKKLNGADTVYYSVKSVDFFSIQNQNLIYKNFDSVNYPVLALCFVKENYKKDGYRNGGLSDYTQYKKDDIEKIPLLLIYPKIDSINTVANNLKDTLKITLSNIEQCYWRKSSFDSINYYYFKEKPVYIDYSFIVLLDKQRHIRGYYDGRYVAEIKRLLQEYKHIRLKEEKDYLIKANEIKNIPNK